MERLKVPAVSFHMLYQLCSGLALIGAPWRFYCVRALCCSTKTPCAHRMELLKVYWR